MRYSCSCYLREGGYVFIGVCLLVCMQDYARTHFTEFGWKVGRRPRKKQLDFVILRNTLQNYYYYYYYKMYWLEWRCHSITVTGALNNEKEKAKALSAVSLECQMTMKTALSSVLGKRAAMMTQPDRRRPFQARAAATMQEGGSGKDRKVRLTVRWGVSTYLCYRVVG